MKKKAQDFVWMVSIVFAATLIFVFSSKKEFKQQELPLEIPSVDYWQKFAEITKERKYVEEAKAHYRIPIFTEELIALSGKEVTLSGYYLPYSRLDSVIIISRYPNASCFFCGQAGIESVAMVELGKGAQQYRMDQRLIVRGKLMLNSSNVKKLAFVLEDALVEEL